MLPTIATSSHASICWLLSGSQPDNSQQMDAYELIYWLADKCLRYFFEARWNCEGVDDDN